MANYLDLMSLFEDIGGAINDKGVSGRFYPNQMASAIRTISVGSSINNQSLTIVPSTTSGVYNPGAGYTGLGPVTVEAIPSSYIIPSGTYTVDRAHSNIDIKQYAILSVPGVSGDESPNMSIVSSTAKIIGSTTFHSGFRSTVQTLSGYITLPSTSISHITPTSSAQSIIPQYRWTLNEVIVDAIPNTYVIPSGTLSVTTNGTYNVVNYASVSVNVPVGATISNYTPNAVTPTETAQTIDIPTGYTGLGQVTVNAISSNYVGTNITRRNSITLTSNTGNVLASAGYYSAAASITLPTTAGTTIYPSTVSQTAVPQYNWTTGSVIVAAMPQPTTLPAINGEAFLAATGDYDFGVTVTIPEGWYSETTLSQNFASVYPALGSQASAPHILAGKEAYDGLGHIVSGGMTNNGKVTATLTSTTTTYTIPAGYHDGTGTVSHTTVAIPAPTFSFNAGTGVITASGSWTRGFTTNSTYTNTYSLTLRTSVNVTVNGSSITTASGYYSAAVTKSVASMTLPTTFPTTSTGTVVATIGRSTATRYLNIPIGYNTASRFYTISPVANGAVTAPTNISGASATITTGTNTLTFTKTISVTPNVTTAGYISSGTAGDANVALTANITTKAAATYNTSTANQTIASGTYLTGTQTIRAVTTSNLSAANIKAGVTVNVGDSADADRIAGATGTFTADATATAADIREDETAYVNGQKITGSLHVITYYTGSTAPSDSVGIDGDIYLMD